MKSSSALISLADITSSQWGMVTAAQAGVRGVPRLTLSRLTDAGYLVRLAHGVYRDAGAPSDQFEDLRAAWLSTEPKLTAEERLDDLTASVVVAGTSAALLHGVGDLWADRHEFVTTKRRQTQRAEIRYRQRDLDGRDVALVEGLPVMTLERTLADLLDDVGEMSLVADALAAAVRKRPLDFDRLLDLFAPLAARNGFRRHDGNAVLEHLLEISGLDLDSIARRFGADPVLSTRIVDNYLKVAIPSTELPEIRRIVQQIKQLMPMVPAELTQQMQELRQKLEVIQRSIVMGEELRQSLTSARSAGVDRIVSELLNTSAMVNVSKPWAKSSTTPRGDEVVRGVAATRQGAGE